MWFQVSLVLLALVAVPVIALWSVTEPVLLLLGVAPNLARIAGHYALILIASIPPMIISSQLAKMLEAQRIMYPSVVAALAAMACNVLFGLVFVLGVGIPGWSGFGFLACPTVTAAMEWLQLAVVYFVFIAWKGLHKPCWPGWAWRHVTRTRLVAYARLYGPASLSIASDFWRVAFIGTVAATFGATEVAVFTTSYRIMWIGLTFVGSVSAAVSIRLGIAFGRGDAADARYLSLIGMLIVCVFVVGVGSGIALFSRQLGSIFSSDPVILDEFERVGLPLALTTAFMNLSVAFESIVKSMGRPKIVLYTGFVGSWVFQAPAAFLLSRYVHYKSKLYMLYCGMAVGYIAVLAMLGFVILNTNWAKYAAEAQARGNDKLDKTPAPEASPLLAGDSTADADADAKSMP